MLPLERSSVSLNSGSVLPPGGQYEDFEIYLTGEHADLFSSTATDDDSEPRNGFTYHFKTNQPLVAGSTAFISIINYGSRETL